MHLEWGESTGRELNNALLLNLLYVLFFVSTGLMEAISEELRIATSTGGQNSNIKFTTIYPYMVDTGLCKNPKIK